MRAMTHKHSSADWARLSQIFYELNNPEHSLRYALMTDREAAIVNAVKSGDVPVRGRRDHFDAFARIEKRMTPEAEISVHWDTAAVRLVPSGGETVAIVTDGMRLGSLSLPRIVFALPTGPKRAEYIEVEADRRAVEAWIAANALPAGWTIEKVRSPAGAKPKADWDALEDALKLRVREIDLPDRDHDDKKWRCREDVIRWAQDFLNDRKEPVAHSTIGTRIDAMLRRLRSGEEEPKI